MRHRTPLLVFVLIVLASAFIWRGGVRPLSAQTGGQPVRLPGHVLGGLGGATRSAAAAATTDQPIMLTLVLNRDDEAGFEAFAKGVEDPKSPSYHGFLSQSALTARFGPSQRSYDAVLAYLKQSGFTLVRGSDNHMTLTVHGTRTQAEQALGVRINDYQAAGRTFFANDTDPALPAAIAGSVRAINGLNNLAQPERDGARPIALPRRAELSDSPPIPRNGASIAAAYDAGGLGAGVNGAGQKIGLVQFTSWDSNDVASSLGTESLPASLINNYTGSTIDGGVSGTANADEAILDIVAALGVAQGASVVAYNAAFSDTFAGIFNFMIGDGDTVISTSWHLCETFATAADVSGIESVLTGGAASGVTVFASSGDHQANCGGGATIQTQVPADAPHATAVGGTNLQVSSGNVYASETFWNVSATDGGGYGVSMFGTLPPWQAPFTGAAHKSVPDMAYDADPSTGIAVCVAALQGCFLFGGTSLSAPLAAASMALVNQKYGHNSGNLNPTMYQFAGTSAFHSPASMGTGFSRVGIGSFDIANFAAQDCARICGPTIAVDSPATNGSVQGSVNVSGWAVDPGSASGTGIDAVHLYLDAPAGTGTFIAGLTYGDARPDIAAFFRNNQFTNSGYHYHWDLGGIVAGPHTAFIYFHSVALGWFVTTRPFVVVQSLPQIALDSPQPGQSVRDSLTVSGWAVDQAAASGTGIDAVHLYRDGFAGAGGVFVAGLPYGSARPDVASYLGSSRFTNAGYSYQWNLAGLAPGPHTVVIYAHSVVSGWAVITRGVTVAGPPLLVLDLPGAGATVHGVVTVAGWAVDQRAVSGTGIDAVHLYRDGYAGAGGVFVSGVVYGYARQDVANYLGSNQFVNSGYSMQWDTSGLSAGAHTVVVYAHSVLYGWVVVVRSITVQ